jgi:hypothetical protein
MAEPSRRAGATMPDEPEVDLLDLLDAEACGSKATILHLDPTRAGDRHWRALRDAFTNPFTEEFRATGPLFRVFKLVREHGCRCIVIENDYVDFDYRSEYSAFWSNRFTDRGSLAQRWHFFRTELHPDDLHDLPSDPGYLGYSVIRNTELGLTGRTVIVPPTWLSDARLTNVVDRPSLFGNPLKVVGVPFYQQDGEHLVCAHAAAWICHYIAHNRGIIGRKTTAEIAAIPSAEGSKYRAFPATGITAEQLQGMFSQLGIPAFFLKIGALASLPAPFPKLSPAAATRRKNRRQHKIAEADESILRIVCKYLNSGFPVVVLSKKQPHHAFTLVGWRPRKDGTIELVSCDDQIGPYEVIKSPTEPKTGTHRGEWDALMIPLPSKVFLPGEEADTRARQIASGQFDLAPADHLEHFESRSDFENFAPDLEELRGPVSVRARLMEGRRYKAMTMQQERHPQAVRLARLARLPHWVWVVEFQDRAVRDAGKKDVVMAEIVFDSTSHPTNPIALLIMTGSVAIDVALSPDEEFSDQRLTADEDDQGEDARDPGHPSAVASDPEASGDSEDVEMEAWSVITDGRRWRSLITDYDLSDAEYHEVSQHGPAPTAPVDPAAVAGDEPPDPLDSDA